jgi:V/A-type H+-transporting ATPase subunit K
MTISQANFKRKLTGLGVLLIFFVFLVLGLSLFKVVAQTKNIPDTVAVAQERKTESRMTDPGVIKFAFLAAAIAVSVGSLGAGAAVGYVGAAAMGAIGEKPELAGRALIFVGLAEGIAIYGLIIAIMILGKV